MKSTNKVARSRCPHAKVLVGIGGIAALLLLLAGCDGGVPEHVAETQADERGHTPPTPETVGRNARSGRELALEDVADFDAAHRGLIASDPELVVHDASGQVVWDRPAYDFVDGAAPLSVHPSLWRQARLNNIHGLFKVTDRVYQLRGYDLANMTLIEGDTGWIVVDPLTVRETAQAAWAFAREHLVGDRPIAAVVFTHSHIDHFGGVTGLPLDTGVRVVAPAGFLAEATSENIFAGPAMGRRAAMMYGYALDRSPRGHLDAGLGKTPARGHFGILQPTHTIDATGQTLTIDGVEFEFQHVPGSEAPAEFTFYLPQFKAFCGAELVSRTLHNVYTPRGAQVRDALRWSDYIDEAIGLFGHRAEVLFNAHHWPEWGQQEIVTLLTIQRDTYKYIHDQTMRLANAGYTPDEIAETLELPASLQNSFHNRGYYGTVRHNSRAVYQRYFGWYDGNPANLDPLPPSAASERYVAFMGGADAVVSKARESFEAGEYRWTAQVLNHVMFADPGHAPARDLLAKAYDQLGYQAESASWRDIYLSGALELRHGAQSSALDMTRALDLLRQVPIETFLASMATRLDGPRAEGEEISVNFHFIDLEENYRLWIENAVLHHERMPLDIEAADITMHMTREFLLQLVTGQVGMRKMLFSDALEVEGNRLRLLGFFSLFERPSGEFEIVRP